MLKNRIATLETLKNIIYTELREKTLEHIGPYKWLEKATYGYIHAGPYKELCKAI